MKKLALQALIASVTLSALVGIYVLLFGSDSDLEGKILVTALTSSALSILVMACGAALERQKLGVLPQAGMVLSLAAYILLMVVIWASRPAEPWAQAAMSLATAGTATALACLLSLAMLAARFRWVRWLGYGSALALTILMDLFIWHVLGSGNERAVRMMGVLAIVLGAVTITVPILHRMSQREAPGEDGPVRHCVACGADLGGVAGAEVGCPACGARFRVEFRVPGRVKDRSSE